MNEKRLWIWYWVGGGYNSCYAATKEEALEKAGQITNQLKVDEKTLHIGTDKELRSLDSLGW